MKHFLQALTLGLCIISSGCLTVPNSSSPEWDSLRKAETLTPFLQPTADWTIVGKASVNSTNNRLLKAKSGEGIVMNGLTGKTKNLLTNMEHGDIEAHIEFMIPAKSNSGVYFQGRYEVQVLDSFTFKTPRHSHCGGIYQRWANDKGFEGHAPRVNAARKPGEWQTFDIVFYAPRFDEDGKKIRNAVFRKVVLNGIMVHENQEVTGPTRSSTFNDEKPTGPLMFQGDHGPVAYRNIRIKSLNN